MLILINILKQVDQTRFGNIITFQMSTRQILLCHYYYSSNFWVHFFKEFFQFLLLLSKTPNAKATITKFSFELKPFFQFKIIYFVPFLFLEFISIFLSLLFLHFITKCQCKQKHFNQKTLLDKQLVVSKKNPIPLLFQRRSTYLFIFFLFCFFILTKTH